MELFDAIICGGGPAGFGAAVAAGRAGARTLLVERLGFLGGMHTGAGVINWCDTPGGPIFDEMLERLDALGGVRMKFDPTVHVQPGRPAVNTELSKMVQMQMLREAGVEVLLLTFVEGAVVSGSQVRGVTVVNKAGRTELRAKVVIDTTADADVAASAGAAFDVGDDSDGRLQHCNYRLWWENIDHERYQAHKPPAEQLRAWCVAAVADGRITPPDHLFQPAAETFPFNDRYGDIQLSAWEFEKVDPLDPWQVSRLLCQCQQVSLQLVTFLREHLPGHEQCGVRKLADVLGVRESRRIVGRYTLTEDDVLSARKFDDGIARGCFFIDLHDSPPGTTIPFDVETIWRDRPPRGEHYEIPYRCLLPRAVEGLLVAGRCISADRKAHGSARVMATCLYEGAAAGTAAAMAAAAGVMPSAIDGKVLREKLAETDAALA